MKLQQRLLLAALAASLPFTLQAQAGAESAPVAVPEPVAQPQSSMCVDCMAIPALTRVSIQVVPALGSQISKTGDTFEIRLAEPIVVDGKALVPAGTMGMGEVVHAKKPGGSGTPGELILAARYLEIGDRQLRLRSMNFAESGVDKYKTVNSILIASSATIPAIAFIGFGINGKDLNVPAGTLAAAKTSAAFELPASPAAAAAEPPPVQPGQ